MIYFVVIGLGRPISAIVLVLGVMVIFVSLLTAGETCHGIVVSTFLCDVVGLSTFFALTKKCGGRDGRAAGGRVEREGWLGKEEGGESNGRERKGERDIYII